MVFQGVNGFKMQSFIDSTQAEHNRNEQGLIFDAEGVTLVGQFNDEFSAYRARREWQKVLKTYFLLESERDYDMSLVTDKEAEYNVLSCYFTSACGRYAFWRLINDQAPEAEQKLFETNPIHNKSQGGIVNSIWPNRTKAPKSPWVLDTSEEEEKPGVIVKMFSDISKLFRS